MESIYCFTICWGRSPLWILVNNRFRGYYSNTARFSVKRIAFMLLFERRITVFVIEGSASFHQNSNVSNWLWGYSLSVYAEILPLAQILKLHMSAKSNHKHYFSNSFLLLSIKTDDMIANNKKFSLYCFLKRIGISG